MNHWIEEHYEELKKICQHISHETDVDDLFHSCLEQFLRNKNTINIPDDKQKIYFFTRLVKNNYNSVTSNYHYEYRRMKFSPIQDIEKPQEIPTDEVTIEWVRNELNEMKKTDQWYYGRLFELYLEGGGSIVELSKKTTIPVNSVSRDINKVRKILRKKRNELWM